MKYWANNALNQTPLELVSLSVKYAIHRSSYHLPPASNRCQVINRPVDRFKVGFRFYGIML